MKMKHNKKRNSAFLFEVLIRELTKAVVSQDSPRKKKILSIVRENFKSNTILSRDLELYKSILETQDVDRHTAEKIIFEARLQKKTINHKLLFEQQSELIKTINAELSSDVFNNFVPNYKDIATIFQIFHPKTRVKNRVLLESEAVESMMSNEEKQKEYLKPIDNLTYKVFVNKFNQTYGTALLSEQKELLKYYVGSFADNGIELKIYLNEEMARLEQVISGSLELEEVRGDNNMTSSTNQVLGLLSELRNRDIDNVFIRDILKLQNLAKEIEE
jgi:hypothetical protein